MKQTYSSRADQFPYLMHYGKIQNLPVFLQSATFYTDLYFGLKEKKKD